MSLSIDYLVCGSCGQPRLFEDEHENEDMWKVRCRCDDQGMEKEKLHALLRSEQLTLKDVIDAVIEINAFVGVGVIQLADEVNEYILERIRR
jgi:hypothetical protein